MKAHGRIAGDYAALVRHYEEMMDCFGWKGGEVSVHVPEVSAWSAAQQIEHVAKSKQSILARLSRLARDNRTDNAEKRPTPRGRVILLAGFIPRGAGKSPERFAASAETDVNEITTLASTVLSELRSLEPDLAMIEKSTGRFPHPYFGHLDGREWVRFMRIHTWHHLKIVKDIRKHLDTRVDART